MQALNEPIARMANREDGCTGRFWEGRFKCQALLDERAILSCMAYVDLNPVRAGMCEALRDSEHTSVRYRIESARSAIGKALERSSQDQALKPVAGRDVDALSDLTESSYIEIVRWTGLQSRAGKRGKLSAAAETPPDGLWNVANPPRDWINRVQGTESRYYRAIGSAEALMLKAADLGQRWMKGVSREFVLKKLREQPVPWQRASDLDFRLTGVTETPNSCPRTVSLIRLAAWRRPYMPWFPRGPAASYCLATGERDPRSFSHE